MPLYAEVDTSVPALCREHGMSNTTFYKWKYAFGGVASCADVLEKV